MPMHLIPTAGRIPCFFQAVTAIKDRSRYLTRNRLCRSVDSPRRMPPEAMIGRQNTILKDWDCSVWKCQGLQMEDDESKDRRSQERACARSSTHCNLLPLWNFLEGKRLLLSAELNLLEIFSITNLCLDYD